MLNRNRNEGKRDRLKIIYDILNLIRNHDNKIKPTPLLRYSNLSSQNFSNYIDELLEKEFVEEFLDKKKRKHLRLTDRGYKYLEKYKTIVTFVNDFNL